MRLTHLDGKLPNLALMKLAHWHRSQGAQIAFTKRVERHPNEPDYSHVYGSATFQSRERVEEFKRHFPDAVIGGTYDLSGNGHRSSRTRHRSGPARRLLDLSGFTGSIGFTQRGCRLKCGFCVVPKKEGKPRSVNTIG